MALKKLMSLTQCAKIKVSVQAILKLEALSAVQE